MNLLKLSLFGMKQMLTEQEKATNYDTFRHIERVRNLLNLCIQDLLRRGELHDQTKLEPPEVALFAEYTPKLAGCTYGSDEYKQYLAAIKPALDHHYAHNRHHPEFTRVTEIWKPIINFEMSHEVSSFGDIRAIEKEVNRSGGQGNISKKSQMLKYHITPRGYARIQLTNEGTRKNILVHRAVAQAFIDNPDNKPFVNHKDGNKLNNHISNLEWVTSSENLQHAYDNDLKKANIKYVVECPELGLTAHGCEQMASLLREAGYEKASPSAIWRVINDGGKHLDLEFVGSRFETWMSSPLNNMNLMDIVEMLCDWKAASERHHDGNIRKSIQINTDRFNISPQLVEILENTADILFKE